MLYRLDRIEKDAARALIAAKDEAALQGWKTKFLGRSSELGEIFDGLRELPKEERRAVGKRVNEVKTSLESAHQARLQELHHDSMMQSLREERLDVTLPGRPIPRGRIHPANQTLRQILAIWADMGFQVYRSRDVETDEYNFGLLNMPPHHPARDMWDTFFTNEPGIVLRTHTSPGQIHVMRERAPEPVRVVLPGMCYRYEQITARAEIQFNQVEGLLWRLVMVREMARHTRRSNRLSITRC